MQKRTMLSKNDTVKSMKKSKIAKEEWEGNDYSPITSEKDIERALAQEFSGRFDGIVKLQYVGTDWAMGSQYWVALFKCKNAYENFACVTVVDWSRYEPERGITTLGYAYGKTLEEVEEIFNEKVARESRGTRKSMMKSKGEKMKSKSVRKGKSINWSHKVLNIERVVRDIENELYDTYWDNAPDRYWTEKESNLYHQIDDGLDELESAVNRYYDLLSDADYSASAKKSKRELLKAKVDELLEEEDDEIAKPRMKDMFLDSKRKSRKSTKSNDEKGEDADEYREESDGDDVSDSKVVKPEEANDNEDENEAPSGGNSSLPEDADGQENQSTKRKKRMSKFSVTAGGSQPYNGRQNYNQSPMMREAIDRFKAEKDLVKSLQDRVDEINGARKNTEVNNKSPLRIKGRY